VTLSIADQDELVEQIARRVEEGSLLDLLGIATKRKRAREDATLIMNARRVQQREIASLIRSFKSGRGNSPFADLERVAAGDTRHYRWRDIADLVERGYVEADAVLPLTGLAGNCINPSVTLSVRATDEGLRVLAERRTKSEFSDLSSDPPV
jgi:hypothetical protein